VIKTFIFGCQHCWMGRRRIASVFVIDFLSVLYRP